MSKAFDILSELRNKKSDEANKLFDEFDAIINAESKTDNMYQVGLKWAKASGEAAALTEAIVELLKAGVI